MRSVPEILCYIESFVTSALERPPMFASSPLALEEKLDLLDKIRNFILCDDPANSSFRDQYSQFLCSEGFGVSQFTSQFYPDRTLTAHDEVAFRELAEFWRKYLASQGHQRFGGLARSSE
jgi:hypothetical protein